jgi:hypothetical protein
MCVCQSLNLKGNSCTIYCTDMNISYSMRRGQIVLYRVTVHTVYAIFSMKITHHVQTVLELNDVKAFIQASALCCNE